MCSEEFYYSITVQRETNTEGSNTDLRVWRELVQQERCFQFKVFFLRPPTSLSGSESNSGQAGHNKIQVHCFNK